jgi:hypothetical protein
MFQDICSTDRCFGGVTVVFGGDFQQTLPVVPKGTRPDIVQATLQRSQLWNNVHVLQLHQNMRVVSNPNSFPFINWLLAVGHGRSIDSQNTESSVNVPDTMISACEEDLITRVYGSLNHPSPMPEPNFFRERAILAPRNNQVRTLNSTILDRFPGVEKTYSSADSYSMDCPNQEQNLNLPVEFLHSLNASGLPIAHLRLKLGCPIILLRNIDTKRGLCNGTRATILRFSHRILEIRLIGGDHDGETALIPRITLSPSLTGLDYAIKLNRRQFPIQLAFAMTVHKSQGQTLNHVGIDLRKPVFAHGQLYVAFSRATSPDHVNVLLPENNRSHGTTNIVYNEILLD